MLGVYSLSCDAVLILLILLLKLFWPWPLGALCSWLTSFLVSFPDFPAPQKTHVVSSLSQPWRPPLLQGALVPFIGEWYGETKFWALGLSSFLN